MNYIFSKLNRLACSYSWHRIDWNNYICKFIDHKWLKFPQISVDFIAMKDNIREYEKQFLEILIPSRKQYPDKASSKEFIRQYMKLKKEMNHG